MYAHVLLKAMVMQPTYHEDESLATQFVLLSHVQHCVRLEGLGMGLPFSCGSAHRIIHMNRG